VDFATGIVQLSAETQATFVDRLDEVPGIFALMEPMPGAVDSFTELAAVFDTYILSTSPWENPSAWCDKLAWVKKHLGAPAYKRLILSHHKHLNRGDYLVDDREKNGAGEFVGELVRFGSASFPDWETVREYLMRESKTTPNSEIHNLIASKE